MVVPRPNHGRRLTGAEYDRLRVALEERAPTSPDSTAQRALRRAEFDLVVDHRLGQDFPRSRRDALFQVSERIEHRRLWLGIGYLLSTMRPASGMRGATRLANRLQREYAALLTPEEFHWFFADDEEAG